MPTIFHKTSSAMMETRREILQAIHWQVRSNVWSPPTDIYEVEGEYVVRVEIAGMHEDHFEVMLESSLLTIRGHRHGSQERCAYHQMEIQSGKFEIVVGIPTPINGENARADYKDGFLTIHLPKQEPAQESKDQP